MSVRARLTLWNVGILAALLLLAGGILRARVQTRLERNLDRELERRSGFLKNFPRERDFPPREFRRERGRDGQRTPPPIPVFDESGASITGNPRRAEDLPALREALAARKPLFTTRGDKRLYSVPLERHGSWATFQEAESLEPVRREVRELTGELLTLLPFGLLAAAAGGMFLTSRALRPVEDLRRAAESIEATDLSQRLAVSGKDEFARLTTTFNAMLGRLEEAFERQRRFVGDASHELKTPLTIVRGAAELGRTDPDASEKSKKLFGRVEGAAERMSRLVQNLLLLARSDSGALEPRIESLNARELLDAVAAEAKLLRPDSAPILVEATDGATISGDRDLLFQLLLNLADNALRHTPAEGGTVTLATIPGGFSVTDTGIGIAPEHLPHLTERFYRIDSSRARKDGGTGLGLAICDSLARAHGGSLEIQSEEGQGTTVRVMLPG